MDNNYLIALDQSSQTTGFAIYSDEELIEHGAVTFSGDIEQRLVKLHHWLAQKFIQYPNARLAFEDIQLQDLGRGNVGVTTYKKLAWVQGMLITFCGEHKINYEIIPPATWRSICGVKGQKRADQKKSAQDRVAAKYLIVASEDEADAICLGEAAISRFWSN